MTTSSLFLVVIGTATCVSWLFKVIEWIERPAAR